MDNNTQRPNTTGDGPNQVGTSSYRTPTRRSSNNNNSSRSASKNKTHEDNAWQSDLDNDLHLMKIISARSLSMMSPPKQLSERTPWVPVTPSPSRRTQRRTAPSPQLRQVDDELDLMKLVEARSRMYLQQDSSSPNSRRRDFTPSTASTQGLTPSPSVASTRSQRRSGNSDDDFDLMKLVSARSHGQFDISPRRATNRRLAELDGDLDLMKLVSERSQMWNAQDAVSGVQQLQRNGSLISAAPEPHELDLMKQPEGSDPRRVAVGVPKMPPHRPSLPGAYAASPSHGLERREDLCLDLVGSATDHTRMCSSTHSSRRSYDSPVTSVVPMGEPVDEAEEERLKLEEKRKKQCVVASAGVGLVLVLATVVVAAILLSSGSRGISAPPLSEHVLRLFPNKTLEAIRNGTTPQAQAYEWLMPALLGGSYSDSHLMQRYAVATFYFSTHGNKWGGENNWLSLVDHECGWTGITCNEEEQQVTEITLTRKTLSGTIPPEFYWLTHLQTVNLGLNKIAGSVAAELGQLTSLQVLELDYNNLEGGLPSELGLLTGLHLLDLSSNDLTGSIPESSLAQLTSLEFFKMYRNDLSGTVPTQFGLLANLEEVGLSYNSLSGTVASEFGVLDNLRTLAIGFNGLMGRIPEELEDISGDPSRFYNSTSSRWEELPDKGFSLILQLNGNFLTGTVPEEVCKRADWLLDGCTDYFCSCGNRCACSLVAP